VALLLSTSSKPTPPYLFLQAMQEGGITPEYARSLLETLKEWKPYLEAQDCLLTPESQPPDNTVLERHEYWLPDNDIDGALSKWMQLTDNAISMVSVKRWDVMLPHFLHMRQNITPSIYLLLEQAGLREQPEAVPQEITNAIKRYIAQQFEAFEQKDRTAIGEGIIQGPLYIDNPELAQKKFSTDPYEWLEDKMHGSNGFPAFYLTGLNKIRFTEFETNNGDVKLGDFNYLRHELSIGAEQLHKKAHKRYHRRFPDPAEAMKAITNENRKNAEETFDHEATHYAHRYTLPLSWLRKWTEIVQKERVDVSPYVKHVYHTKGKEGNPLAEDLAESVALYKNDLPTLLRQGAFSRIVYLNDLFQLYDNSKLEERIRSLKEHNATDAQPEGNSSNPHTPPAHDAANRE
jgi:hypothetical protein